MKTSLSSAAREIQHWRNFFRTRDDALRRAARASDATPPASEYPLTEWAETDWPDTDIDPRER